MLKVEHTNLLAQKKIIDNEFHQLILKFKNLPEGKIKGVQRDTGQQVKPLRCNRHGGEISVYANKHILFNK